MEEARHSSVVESLSNTFHALENDQEKVDSTKAFCISFSLSHEMPHVASVGLARIGMNIDSESHLSIRQI